MDTVTDPVLHSALNGMLSPARQDGLQSLVTPPETSTKTQNTTQNALSVVVRCAICVALVVFVVALSVWRSRPAKPPYSAASETPPHLRVDDGDRDDPFFQPFEDDDP